MKYIIYMITAFFGDLFLKNRAERSLADGKAIRIAGNNVRLKLYRNSGAMLNAGEGHKRIVASVSLSLSILLSIFFVLSLAAGRSVRFKAALSLLLGGAWSNTYDRLKKGYVVDYISFPFLGRWVSRIFGERAGSFVSGIVFNISDFFIIGGCLFTAIFSENS